jgi:hypothetical protein
MIIRPEEEFIVTFEVKATVSIMMNAPDHDLAIERAQLQLENMNSKELCENIDEFFVSEFVEITDA